MRFDFLSANTWLGKKFTASSTESYPMVKEFTSHTEHADTLEQLLGFMEMHAEQGHCMLKGHVQKQLQNQSRAGSTSAHAKTEFLVLDLDFQEGFASVDDFMKAIGMEDVSYIWHHSSSAGIKYTPGLRGHAIVLLNKALTPETLKQWLRHCNLQIPELTQRLELAASQMALRWPLDVTTCQNDKLIYIADPMTDGVEDPLKGQRFELRTRGKERATLDVSKYNRAVIDEAAAQAIDNLREESGLPKRKPKMQSMHDIEFMANPDKATVTGVKRGRGFTYLNLNGGDSWAYYYPEDDPTYLFNFKGEPVVRLRDIAPDHYWAVRREQAPQTAAVPIAFRDRKTDVYYNGYYDKDNQELDIAAVGNKQRIGDFFITNGQMPPEVIEDKDLIYDPTSLVPMTETTVNKFKPSIYMKNSYAPNWRVPPLIKRVLTHALGDCEETYEYFLNWLACLYQTRSKLGTAWVLSGTTGTGKGTLKDKILTPLLGMPNVSNMTTSNLFEQYNAYLEDKLLVWVDEADLGGAQGRNVASKLKSYITEPVLPIRKMRTNEYQAASPTNFIFVSNYHEIVMIESNDRRYNFAPKQMTKIQFAPGEYDSIEEELPLFAAYLQHYEINLSKARTPLENEARAEQLILSQTNTEMIFEAVKRGDVDFFVQYIGAGDASNVLLADRYEKLVNRWEQEAISYVTNADLKLIFQYILDNRLSPVKIGRLSKMHGCEMHPKKINGESRRAYRTEFTSEPADESDASNASRCSA